MLLSHFIKSNHPLAACTLSPKECQSIIIPIIKVALPKSSITTTIYIAIRNRSITSGSGRSFVYFIFMDHHAQPWWLNNKIYKFQKGSSYLFGLRILC